MKKLLSIVLIALAALVTLVAAALLIIPLVVDVEKFKPRIEKLVTEKTGYPMTLGGDIDLSLFPWVGLTLSSVELDNPEGFENRTFVSVENFQAHLKVMPLLSRKVEVSKFVLEKPQVTLERTPEGRWNFQKPAAATPEAAEESVASGSDGAAGSDTATQPPAAEQPTGSDGSIGLEQVAVGEFLISDGRLLIDDRQQESRHQVTDISLELQDVSLDQPIGLMFTAVADGTPMELGGTVGPLGHTPGTGEIPFDLALRPTPELELRFSGSLSQAAVEPSYRLDLSVPAFNPRPVLDRFDLDLAPMIADPTALSELALELGITGSTSQAVLERFKLELDDTTVTATGEVTEFSGPTVALDLSVDQLDLDRYLPPASAREKTGSAPSSQGVEQAEAGAGTAAQSPTPTTTGAESSPALAEPPEATAPAKPPAPERQGIDFAPLRKLALNLSASVGNLQVKGGRISDLALRLNGSQGLFTLDPLSAGLYQGTVQVTGTVDVRQDQPLTALAVDLQEVQSGPLLQDFADKDSIEGQLAADIDLTLEGLDADRIKRSLNGTGILLFIDGALVGIDLAEMARTIQSGFTLEQQAEKPKTDFAELRAPFTITDGLVDTRETSLKSPFLRVQASGTANLVSESLDLRVEPKLVATIKGQGDQEQRRGLGLPILVTGTFQKPEFTADLKSLVQEQLPDEEELAEILKTGEVPEARKQELKKELEQAEQLFKGLFGN